MIFVVEDIGGRPYQEDRHSVKMGMLNKYDYVAIFDGHGGYQVAEFLKFHLKDFVEKHLSMKKSPPNALKDAFHDAHAAMPKDMSFMTGAAVVVVLRRGNQLWVANAGDSRAIKITSTGVSALSDDHKPSRLSEYNRIQQLGGVVTFNPNDVPRVQGNLALSRSLGDRYLEPYVTCDPEIKHFTVNQNSKYIILATDGLWDVLSNSEVRAIVEKTMVKKQSKRKLAHDCIYELLKEARRRNSQDNTSIIFWVLE